MHVGPPANVRGPPAGQTAQQARVSPQGSRAGQVGEECGSLVQAGVAASPACPLHDVLLEDVALLVSVLPSEGVLSAASPDDVIA